MVFLTLLRIGKALHAVEVIKNRKVLNIASSPVLSCSAFLPILCMVFNYARTFDKASRVPLREDRVVQICRNLESANAIRKNIFLNIRLLHSR